MGYNIEIIGLGAGDLDQLPLGVYRKLKSAEGTLFVRTKDHPVVDALVAEGMIYQAFDDYYESEQGFETVYEKITAKLLEMAKAGPVLYAVPGHPMLAEKSVQLLLAQAEIPVEVIGGHSYLDDLFTALKIDPIDGFQFVDGTQFDREALSYSQHIIFCQVYDAFIASRVKLALLEDLPADYEVTIVEAAGTSAEKLLTVPLEDLDRVMEMSNLVSVYIPPVPQEHLNHTFKNLRHVIATLRGEAGCPWDRKQTHESLREFAIEEVYELIDAINRQDDEGIIEELGDVLLQVMLHSQIGEDDGYFTIDDVIRNITKKMIHRHPAVFNGEQADKSWDELKQEENPELKDAYLLDSVIKESPALQVAYKMQRKVAKVGFNWTDVAEIWSKFQEEKFEFLAEVEVGNMENMEAEFGDILFVLSNIALFHGLNPELALQQANEKFVRRFNYIERQLRIKGIEWSEATFSQMELFWQGAKEKE